MRLKTLKNVFELCQQAISWDGVTINSVDSRNTFDDTPLHTICSWGNLDAAKILLANGADKYVIIFENTTPYEAAKHANLSPEILKLLTIKKSN